VYQSHQRDDRQQRHSIEDLCVQFLYQPDWSLFPRNAPSIGAGCLQQCQQCQRVLPALDHGLGPTFGVVRRSVVPYTYTTNNNTITITRYTGPGGAVTIPDTINGLPVSSLEGRWTSSWTGLAFQGRTSVTSVTIPDSVTTIGTNAFYNCTNLTSVTIPDSVTNIVRGRSKAAPADQRHDSDSVISIGDVGGGAVSGVVVVGRSRAAPA